MKNYTSKLFNFNKIKIITLLAKNNHCHIIKQNWKAYCGIISYILIYIFLLLFYLRFYLDMITFFKKIINTYDFWFILLNTWSVNN
jgi:hypothetical protein